jgi:hypothetical protein
MMMMITMMMMMMMMMIFRELEMLIDIQEMMIVC